MIKNIEKILMLLLFAIAIVGIIAPINASETIDSKNKMYSIESKKKTVKYNVKWDANGGKIGTKKTIATAVKKGSKIGKFPKTPKRTGYTFQGWYTKKKSGKKITVSNKPTKSVTYTAQWLLTIKWNANGGTIGSKKTISSSVKENTKIGKLPAKPTRKGYIFKGWFTKPNGGTKIGVSNMPTKPVTYSAQWEKDLAPLTSGDDDLAPLTSDDDDLAPLVSYELKTRHLGKWTHVDYSHPGLGLYLEYIVTISKNTINYDYQVRNKTSNKLTISLQTINYYHVITKIEEKSDTLYTIKITKSKARNYDYRGGWTDWISTGSYRSPLKFRMEKGIECHYLKDKYKAYKNVKSVR